MIIYMAGEKGPISEVPSLSEKQGRLLSFWAMTKGSQNKEFEQYEGVKSENK